MPYSSSSKKKSQNAFVLCPPNKLRVVLHYRGDDSSGTVCGRGHHAIPRRVLLINSDGEQADPIHLRQWICGARICNGRIDVRSSPTDIESAWKYSLCA